MEKEDILSLTVENLKAKLQELNLAITGRKAVLQDRLLDHFGYSEEENIEFEEASSVMTPVVKPIFTLKDIRDSVNFFNGTNSPEIDSWITEFEDCATAVQWDDLQKFIYARQLLKGAAQNFIRSQAGIGNWAQLKKILISEFGNKLSAAEIHKMLKTNRKLTNESYLEYLYRLMKISKPLNLDKESLIEYFVDGLPDTKVNKTILYEATSIEELKLKIKVYEKIKNKNFSNYNFKNNRTGFNQNKFCKNCPHLNNHNSEECLKTNKDICFKCNRKGHNAANCRFKQEYQREDNFRNHNNNQRNFGNYNNNQGNSRNYNNNFGNFQNNNPNFHINHGHRNANTVNNQNIHSQLCSTAIRLYTEIKIENVKFSALLDTGSDLCLLTKSVFDQLKNVELIKHITTITGIGQGAMKTLGYINVDMEINETSINWNFHIVEDIDIMAQSLIGNDILKVIDINLSDGEIIISKNKNPKIQNNTKSNVDKEITIFNESFLAGKEFNALCTSDTSFETTIKDKTLHLIEKDKQKLFNILTNYQPFITKNSPVEMQIVLKDEIPIFHRPRRIPISEQQIVEKQVKEWIEAGIIKASRSEYSSPIVLVPKKDGTKRLCCDYRKLNEKIMRDNFPMILIDDVVQKLQKAKFFTTLDLRNGFFHVPIAYESQKYTSFVTHNGQYEFLKVPFGISNSPAIFCRHISAIFHNLIQDGTIIVYMDDIIIPSISIEEGFEKLLLVLNVAEPYGTQFNWTKSQFLKQTVNFLGYIISNSTIKPSLEKTKAVRNFPVPTNHKSIQQFLGLTSYFRRFVQNFALIAKPLSDLLAKNKKFKFEEEENLAFLQLKAALVQEPILKIFSPEAITEIHTDASMFGYGAVLLQKDASDQQFHPVEFMSRKTSAAEQKYHSYELEVMAIIEALRKWRCYVLGIKFKLVTDCNAFTMTLKKQEVPLRVTRWIMFLQDFDFEVEHRSGTKMKHVDALSRIHTLLIQNPLKHRIIEAQNNDAWTKVIKKILLKENHEDYFIKGEILYKDPAKEQIVIPELLEREIIETAHRQGHFSSKKTEEIITKNFYIHKLSEKVKDFVKCCLTCIMADAKSGKKEGLLNPIEKPNKPLETYHIDHVGPLEATKKQYNYLLVIVDAFSKFVWLYPTKSTGAEEAINKLQLQAEIFGNPNKIISDKGSAFTANIFKDYCTDNSIQHHLITTGVPRENGQVERIHRIVLSVLTKLCSENPQNWYKNVGKVQQFINSTPSRSTKFSPFKILTGMEMKKPDILNIQSLIEKEDLEEIQKEIDNVRLLAKNNILKVQEENKKAYNKNRKEEREYNINDLVAIKRTQFGAGLKIKNKFLGPYKVVEKKRLGRYVVVKVGENEGPNKTSTIAEYMKPWN